MLIVCILLLTKYLGQSPIVLGNRLPMFSHYFDVYVYQRTGQRKTYATPSLGLKFSNTTRSTIPFHRQKRIFQQEKKA